MALSTYAHLQVAVADWLERGDLAPRIPDFIALAEAQMNRSLRVRRMITLAALSLEAAQTAVPADLLEIISLTLLDGAERRTVEPAAPAMTSLGEGEGPPRFWSLVGSSLRLHPAPSRPYAAELAYYGRIPPLSDETTSNWVLAEHPDAYLFGALKEAGPFLRDSEAAVLFEAKQQGAIAAIQDAEKTAVPPLRSDLSPLLAGAGQVGGLGAWPC